MTITAKNNAETQRIAAEFARDLPVDSVVLLYGEMGSGKTEFVRGMAYGLGCTDSVSSPTYTLLNVYSGGSKTLFHADLYRLATLDDVLSTGLEDYLYGGICAIEWPEVAMSIIPASAIEVHIVADGELRNITIQ